ncbi:MAG: glycosyltransferase family 2 protein [Candidatus Bathyarchaeota archaeon]|nr:MAG: glycosyltransferase family 2 protein [Candidatus Bathyarchaeum tardum]WNZ28399.1 MAG: glycosyltransferase family 2 protein [Candidatus Bathyarchaeota archaeon]
MIEFLNAVFTVLVIIICIYIARHYLFTVVALYPKNKPFPSREYSNIVYEPKVSVLIPARDEEDVIERILQRMTELTYPKEKFEVIVIDDASTDQTAKNAKRFAKHYDYIHFVQRSQQEGGKGKPEALNYALKFVSGEIIYCFDADYYPQRNVIEKLTESFKDPKVGAVQGRVTVLNESNTIITRLVTLERTGGYRVDQFARNELELIPQYGGTVGGFRRNLIEQLGGWDPNMLAEDTDLTFRIYLAGFTIKYLNYADCYEEAVETWSSYWRQRTRWSTGHMQCAFRYVRAVLRSKNLSFCQKVDGFLLLNIYFLPLLSVLAWILGALLFFFYPLEHLKLLWMVVPLSFYSSVGNFAPFFEVGIGAYLDGRDRICWLIPLLFITFMFNVLICTKSFIDICIGKLSGKKSHAWKKTVHKGNRVRGAI